MPQQRLASSRRTPALPLRRLGGASLLALLIGLPALRGGSLLPGPAWRGEAAGSATPGGVPAALEEALAQVEQLRERVDAGELITDFGERAQAVVTEALAKAGGPAPELERVLDAALHGLFVRQAALLASRCAADASAGVPGANAMEEAERAFLAGARELMRPGATWGLTAGLSTLRSNLEGGLRRGAALTEERARAARTQRATMGVVAGLQGQLEQLQQKAQGARGGGSPWVLSTSYRVPNTPLQFAGRYEQGRANVELSLTPDRNPTDADGGLMNDIGPANLGISFNLGI